MNRHQAEGKVKDVAGKAQRAFGDATDNGSQQIKGGAKQVEGKVQQGIGKVEEAGGIARCGVICDLYVWDDVRHDFTEDGHGAPHVRKVTLPAVMIDHVDGSSSVKRGQVNELQPMGKEEPISEHVA